MFSDKIHIIAIVNQNTKRTLISDYKFLKCSQLILWRCMRRLDLDRNCAKATFKDQIAFASLMKDIHW